jgi:hypothetical protein
MQGQNEITNREDIIDSRDIIARIEWLEDAAEAETIDDDERDELAALKAFAAEADSADDWQHGATLIRDSHFKEYAQGLADDIGAIDRNATWPANCIDWDEAADLLRQDYFSAEFGGVEYWVR